MEFFKKKKPWNEINTTVSWSVFEGAYNDLPMIVRNNNGIKELIAHKELPYRIGFAIPLNHPDENGFPITEEISELDKIEDKFQETLKQYAVPALIITTNKMREFVFYSSNSDDIIRWYENGNQNIYNH